jgi:RNase P/RNase MRP subunit p30
MKRNEMEGKLNRYATESERVDFISYKYRILMEEFSFER